MPKPSEFDEDTLQGAIQQLRDALGDEVTITGGHIYPKLPAEGPGLEAWG